MPEATDVIRHEHSTIRMMSGVLDGMLEQYATGQSMPSRDLADMAIFFVRFADNLHHAKEEFVLFPALARRDASLVPLLDVLMEDHDHIREILERLDVAADSGRREDYITAAREYLAVLHIHLPREQDELLPAADRILTSEEQRALANDLATLQSERINDPELSQLLEFQHKLAARYYHAE